MQTATVTPTDMMAQRVIEFGASLPERQRRILRRMVGAGRVRLARASREGRALNLTARDAEEILSERAMKHTNSAADWTFDIWKHSF